MSNSTPTEQVEKVTQVSSLLDGVTEELLGNNYKILSGYTGVTSGEISKITNNFKDSLNKLGNYDIRKLVPFRVVNNKSKSYLMSNNDFKFNETIGTILGKNLNIQRIIINQYQPEERIYLGTLITSLLNLITKTIQNAPLGIGSLFNIIEGIFSGIITLGATYFNYKTLNSSNSYEINSLITETNYLQSSNSTATLGNFYRELSNLFTSNDNNNFSTLSGINDSLYKGFNKLDTDAGGGGENEDGTMKSGKIMEIYNSMIKPFFRGIISKRNRDNVVGQQTVFMVLL